ncbi:hypothetical protein GUJ93_ZPchr0004g39838 [Zizania palustris]|uniref:Uncharacterized protein n=1 Tax=Zizania palustris TaxID=103762 RepID=A0A8J5SIL7_ZIZPA|nr:hypothetical protein GUJ93_ZPchr0004g39838 [Zizania palustris]
MHGARLLQLQGIRVASVGSDQTPQIVVVVARDAATDGAPRTPPSHHPKNPQLYRSAHSGGRALLVFHSSPRHAPNGTRTRQPGKKTRMHHTKTDSEATSSMAASSPPRVAYYVQSPSHDDGENKTAVSSFHSSPAASPPRSLGHHSRESSSSRFSGAKSGSSRSGVGGGVGGVEAGRGGGNRRSPWMKEATIEEEGLLNEDDDPDGAGAGGGLPKRWRYALGFVGAFFALFFFFALILWGASHNQKPVVSISVSESQSNPWKSLRPTCERPQESIFTLPPSGDLVSCACVWRRASRSTTSSSRRGRTRRWCRRSCRRSTPR